MYLRFFKCCSADFLSMWSRSLLPNLAEVMKHIGYQDTKVTSHIYHRQLDWLSKSVFKLRTKKMPKLRFTSPVWGKSTGDKSIPSPRGSNAENVAMSCRYIHVRGGYQRQIQAYRPQICNHLILSFNTFKNPRWRPDNATFPALLSLFRWIDYIAKAITFVVEERHFWFAFIVHAIWKDDFINKSTKTGRLCRYTVMISHQI